MQSLCDGTLYPLKFSPVLKEKIWGGHRLERIWGGKPGTEYPIGEAWLVWHSLTISNGPWRGKTLGDLVRQYPLQILGRKHVTGQETLFPLLTKLIDAQETLSVQVHPDDNYARLHEGQLFGKYEMWYVIDAEPRSRIIHGVKDPVTRFELKKATETGKLPEVLDFVEVKAGDVVLNPPGTIHALGGGILVYELQQSSDLTYRLYDWDRVLPDGLSRELHIKKAIEVADRVPSLVHKTQPIRLQDPIAIRTFLGACKYFAAELLEIHSQITEQSSGKGFHILTILQGAGHIQCSAQSVVMELEVVAGESILVPASICEYKIQPKEDRLVVIKSYIPDLLRDIVTPLREKGVAWDRILQLGGDPGKSDLGRYVH